MHNLSGFDFFFFVKSLRLGAWRTTNLSIGSKNLSNINFANISDRIKFIDTYKYYQQTLSVLASTMNDVKELYKRSRIMLKVSSLFNSRSRVDFKL